MAAGWELRGEESMSGLEFHHGRTEFFRTRRPTPRDLIGRQIVPVHRSAVENEWAEMDDLGDFEVEQFPREEIYEQKPPEELLETNPRPAPILIALLIVAWLCLPFVASVIFLVVILGIILTSERPHDLHSFRSSFSGLARVGESLGLKALYPYLGPSSGLWDVNIISKVWNQLVNASPSLQAIQQDTRAVAATQVDWIETSDSHVFTADMPGLRKEDVKVELEGDSVLQISGQRYNNGGTAPETLHRLERSQGRFLRRFQLPANALVEDVQAKVEHGVLTVTVPKRDNHPLVVKRSVAIR